jgi:hypothetical protein
VGVVADVAVGPGATTELGDLALTAEGAAALVGLRGFGFEERVAATPYINSFVLLPDVAFLQSGNDLYAVGLDDGAIRIGGRPVFQATSSPVDLSLDLLPGARVLISAGADGYLYSAADRTGLHPEHLLPTQLDVPPGSNVRDALNVERRWSFGAGPDTTMLFTAAPVSAGDPSIRATAWRFTAAGPMSRAELAGGRTLTSVVAVDASPDRLIYVPYFGCWPPPDELICGNDTPCPPNPECTAEEAADEAAGVARVVQVRWPDGCTDSCTPEETLVARIPGARYPDTLLPTGGEARWFYLREGKVLGGEPPGPGRSGLAGNQYYLLHGPVLSRVDLDTGLVTDLVQGLTAADPTRPWLLSVADDDRALLLRVDNACPARLYELPGLLRHDLGSGQHDCTAAFLPGGVVALTTFVDSETDLFSEGGAPLDQIPAFADLTQLHLWPDGSALLWTGQKILLHRPGAQPQLLGPLGLEVQASPGFGSPLALSADGRWVYFLAFDPANDPDREAALPRLFRLELP